MLKKIILFPTLIAISFASSIDLDVKELTQKIQQNKLDIKNRLVLAKYYLDNKNYSKAQQLINEVLKIEPKNKKALLLKERLNKFLINKQLEEQYGDIDNYINKLYKEQKYKEIIDFYTKYHPILKPSTLIKVARVAMWEGKYDLSLKLLSNLNSKDLDVLEIKAYDYFYKGNIIKANRLFKILYNATGNKEYGIKLIQTYIQLGDALSAKKILYSLKYKLSKKEYNHYLKLINKQIYKYINLLKENYQNNPNFDNLKKLVIALYDLNPQEAIKIAQDYVNSHPDDMQANIFLAKLYTWNGETAKASQILDKYINSNNYQAKLLYGKILAWNGLYKKALIFLSDVYENGNEKQKYEALKMIGFIHMWQGHKKEAKKIFKKLHKINPNDNEVKEALMILNGNIKPLIRKYLSLVKDNPNNMEYVLKLADLYYADKNYAKAAKYYEIYLKNNPDKIELYKTLGDIYLQLKEFYKGFSYWEYYAAIKNTPEAYLELAKRYYWNGFNKEALDILNKILNKYPKFKPAIELKAKILKVNPRFIYSENQSVIEKYFNNKAQKLLVYGDRSYFAGFYPTAIEYYKEYLFIKPTDSKVREKYAYALEFDGKYKQAAGEFYNLLWEKKDPILEYHYAYCLQKSGKIKEAKKIYEKLLKEVPKPLPEKIKHFLNEWKKAWESMDFDKYASFYDKKIRDNLYWRLKKQNIFKKAGFISVGIYDPILLEKKGNIYKVKFYQVYASTVKKDKGYKILWIKCDNEKCKIIKEKWYPGEYNPNNPEKSLIFLIKQNLSQINKKEDFIPLKDAINQKNNKIILAEKNIKRESNLTKIQKNLDLIQLKKTYIEQNNTTINSINKNPSYKFNLSLYHFHDNQKIHYNHIEGSLLKNINDNYIGVFSRIYKLNDNNKKDKGNIIGAVYQTPKFQIILGRDNAGKTINPYVDFKTKYLNHTININYENLVYSRKTICSLNHKRAKLEASRFIQLDKIKGLWYSIAGEYIDDSNIAITPQIDYDFYSNYFYNNPYAIYFSGWYQFNTKQTKCYYSPDKTDANLIGIKFYPDNKLISLMLKGAIGYSIWDKSFLYKLGINANKNIKNFEFNAKCEYSNTSPIKTASNYRSYECSLDMEKLW